MRISSGWGKSIGRSALRPVAVGMVALVAIVGAAPSCTVPSVGPDGSVPQVAPVGLNGMAEEQTDSGPAVWAADYVGHQLLRFDPDTGTIDERHGGLCDTDDVVVAPDGSLLATCAGPGTVVRLSRDGHSEVLARVGRGVNPIALEPGGDAVVVGFGTDDHDELIRVPLDGSPTEVIADDLPVLNGFGFGPDGRLYVPTGGAAGLLGNTGGLAVVDVTTGELTTIPLTVGGVALGIAFAVGVDVGADGTVYIAQGVDPAVWAVDPMTGVATLVGRSPLPYADNITVLDDGRLVVSGFLGSGYVVFRPDGAGGWQQVVGSVGR